MKKLLLILILLCSCNSYFYINYGIVRELAPGECYVEYPYPEPHQWIQCPPETNVGDTIVLSSRKKREFLK